MSEAATRYVRIHLARTFYRNRLDGQLADYVADIADEHGIARVTQAQMAYGVRAHVKSVERAVRRMKGPDLETGRGPVLYKLTGRRWGIVGVIEHDESRCGELECQAMAAAGASAKARSKAAERVRRYRARQKAAQKP